MNQIKAFSVKRSYTKQQLPTIKTKIPRNTNITPNKSSYLGQISEQFSVNQEYDIMDQLALSRQQNRLKNILKKMNDHTVKIISNFTPKKKVDTHHRTATTILAVNQEQQKNNHKIIMQCQKQIQKLMERFESVNYGGIQHFSEGIKGIQGEVQSLKQENNKLRVQNERRGKTILTEKRIIEQGQIRKMQTDVYLAEHRASHLRSDNLKTEQQIAENDTKLKQINKKWGEAELYLKQIQKKNKQISSIKSNYNDLLQKKAIAENMKKKNDFYLQNSQYRYLHLLRQLDSVTISTKEIEQKTQKIFSTIQASKMIIGKLEIQLKNIRMQKEKRERQVNEFLKKQAIEQSKVRMSGVNFNQGLTNELPSEILMKEQIEKGEENESEIDIDNQIAGIMGNNQKNKSKQPNKKEKNEESEESKKKKAIQETQRAQKADGTKAKSKIQIPDLQTKEKS